MNKSGKYLVWTVLSVMGAFALGYIALNRGEQINALWIVVASVCIYLIAYRFYGLYIAKNVLAVDPTRMTPAVRHNDGLDYVPTDKKVLFGHHFAAIAGANNTSQLDTLFALLAQNGTEEIIEAHDMDKYSNQMTSNGASKIYLMARKNGMACRRLTWNPNYKGFDDWQLALREKEQKEKEVQRMNFKQQYLCGKCDFTYIDGCVELWHTRAEKDLDLTEYLGLTKEEYQIFLAQGNRALKDILDSQRVFRRFCIYQLCLGETQTVPFAFKQLDALRKAGYEQPPAAAYQTVWSAEVCCPKGQNDMEVLGRLFLDFNEHLPEDYRGRPLAPSDVVELDCQGKRTYFYVNDCRDFAPVRFSPFLCKRLPEPAQKQE